MKTYNDASEVRVAVIGYGGAFNMGKKHLEECQSAGMTPTAVVDLDASRLKIAQTDFPEIETYTSVATMLKKSTANMVIIITPHNTHAKLATQCAKAGKHVIVEKPFAITTAECDKMIEAAKSSGVLLSTYHNRHWDGCVLGALKKVSAGAIGDVVRIEARMGGWSKPRNWWRSSRSISGGILYDWGVHLLEYSLQLIGSEIVEVTGFATSGVWADKTAWKEDTNEDEATAIVRFASGASLTLRLSALDANAKDGIVEVTGTKGSYVFDHRDYEIVKPKASSVTRECGANPDSEQWRFYKNIANHLAAGEELVITPEWARRPVHILDLAVQSARKGTALKAKYK
jgi:scyllo-inositol 2-dehydrogenase (NADP+)